MKYHCFLVIILVPFILIDLFGQQGQTPLPEGTSLNGATQDQAWSNYSAAEFENEMKWRPPAGRTITAAGAKLDHDNEPVAWYVLLDDGSIYSFFRSDLQYFGGSLYFSYRGRISNVSSGGLRQLYGDDIYAISFTAVYVSRNDGTTWEIDTLGLSGARPRRLILDSLQNVYLATDAGLFKQGLTENVWNRVTSMTKNLSSVFVDRKNRWLFVGTENEGIFKSSNFGASWQSDSSGAGTSFISSFTDDLAGNIYANAGSRLFRSTGGTAPWVRIDANLLSKTANSFANISGVIGKQSLVASTNFGLYRSTDFGATWVDANRGIQADHAYGLMKLPSGRFIVATDLGLFYQSSANASWTKGYPTDLVQQFTYPMYRDKNGVLYTANSTDILKSTNEGTTWTIDNPGWTFALPSVPGRLYVDENGGQHYYPGQVFQTFSSNIYVKSGGNWVADQSGLTVSAGDVFFGFSSDGTGNLFLFRTSTSNATVARRALAGGAWSADTTGLGGKGVISMTKDLTGNMISGTSGGGIYRRANGTWTRISPPPTVSASNPYLLSVDSTGALFVAFSNDEQPNVFRSRGVYYTKDNGSTWTFAGLDSVGIRQLISSGDSTFALTVGRGVAVLRSTPVAQLDNLTPFLHFGNVTVGQSRDLTASIKNTGTSALTITSITSGHADFVPQQTGGTIGAQQSLAIPVRFTATTQTARLAPLVILSNSPTSPDTVRMLGSGVIASGIEKISGLPTEFSLSQNYPNPFNPSTIIQYGIPAEAVVKLEIFDLLGRQVASLVHEKQIPGFYQVSWHAGDLPTGIYFYHLQAGSFVQTKKLILLK